MPAVLGARHGAHDGPAHYACPVMPGVGRALAGVAVAFAVAPAAHAQDGAARIAGLARAAGPAPRPPLAFAIQDDPEFLGHPERLDQTLAEVKALGFTHVRLSAHWNQLTRAPTAARRPRFAAASPGGYEQRKWYPLDRAVVAATRHGLHVMIDVAFFAPRWATRGHGPGESRPRNRIDTRAFTDFAVAIAQRYSGRFAATARARHPLPKVELVTLYNEPNLAVFWTPQRRTDRRGRVVLDSPHAYRRLATRAYAAVKRARPDLRVLIGSLASGPAWEPGAKRAGIPAMRFLREMACVNARLNPLDTPDCRGFRPVPGDGLAIHPYVLGHPPDHMPRGDRIDNLSMGNLGWVAALTGQLAARGRIAPALKDIYITGFGYLTGLAGPLAARPLRNPFPKVALDRQATYQTWAHELAWATPQVKMFSHFLVRDTLCAPGAGPECIDWPSGFRFAGGAPKPARATMRASLLGHPQPDGDVYLWGRLGPVDLRRAAVLEYDGGGGDWRPVAREDVRDFAGGGPDGIFAVRLSGHTSSRFRIGVGPGT
jgi:Cellulase (glycosyl hydrolase family 5)